MLKILLMILILVLLVLPFLPVKAPFTLYFFNYPEKKRPKNLVYIAGTMVIILLAMALMPYVLRFASWFASLGIIKWILKFVPAYATYSSKILNSIFVNILFCAIVLVVNWLTGILCGRYPKFAPKPLKQILAEAKAKRLQRKEERKKKKAEKKRNKGNSKDSQTDTDEKKNDSDTDQKNSDSEQKDTEFKGLPEHLLPEPEKKDENGLVTLFGKKTADKVTKNKGKEIPTGIKNEDDKELTFKKILLRLFSFFYVCHEGVWYVQPQCKKVAKHLRNFILLLGIVYLVIFALLLIPVFFAVDQYAKEFYNLMLTVVDNCYLYPAVSLVLLTQIFWFMNGLLPEEPVDMISYKAGKRTARVIDLDAIEHQLIENFGKEYEIKTFYSGDVEGQQQSRFPCDISDNSMLQSVLAFVQSQKLVRNDDYLRGISMLESGRDVLFDAPLYTAVSMYLYPYLNVRISQGERLVVICQDGEKIEEIIKNLREGFRRVQRAHTCQWIVSTRKELGTDNDTDILVVCSNDFMDDKFFTEAKLFLQRATIALFPDADQVVMSNNYLCMIIAERLRQASGCKCDTTFVEEPSKKVQYLFLSTRHTLNLARSLKEYFLLDEEIYSAKAEYAYGSVRLYIWKAISEARIMLDNSAQTVNLETAISNVARKMGVPDVTMFTKGAIFPNQIDPAWLDTYDIFDRPIGFTIVSDESFNLPGTIYTYSRYVGKEASVLHVISKPYMLRDYFYDNAIRSLYEQPLMERGMTEHARLEQSSMILLLCRLMKGIPVTVFAAKMEEITGEAIFDELTYPVIKSLVDTCLSKAFGVESGAERYGFTLFNRYDNEFKKVKYIQIRESGILNKLMEDTQFATVQIGQTVRTIPLFKRMLAQKYIAGQHMVIDHANYKITSIDYDTGRIIATPATSVHNVPDQYVQIREYTFAEDDAFVKYCSSMGAGAEPPHNVSKYCNLIDGNSEIKNITMVRAAGSLNAVSKTVAFYDSTNCPGQLDLLNSSVFYVETNLERGVQNAMYLRFDGEYAANDKVTMTLAVLLQEMMKTMFPDQHFCISVCPVLKKPESIYEQGDEHSRRIAKMYPKLMNWKAGSDRAIELIIMDDCKGGTGVLDILFDPEATYLRNILDMLYDYLCWLEKHPEDTYLYFGAEECPSLFELGRVKELISVFSRRYFREDDLMKKLNLNDSCKFCAASLTSEQTYLWNNKYNICAECEEEYKPNEEECGLILKNVTKFLYESFGVSMGDTIRVQQSETADVSALDVEDRLILIAPDLPLTMVHSEILIQLVRLWQLENLFVTGECEFEGQLLYVLIQYLTFLRQYQRGKRFHSRALVNSDDRSVGYCRLRQALQALSTENSFKYMLENFGKGGKNSVFKTDPKRSTRKTGTGKPVYHYYENLNDNLRKAYEKLLKGVMAMEESINLEEYKIPLDAIGDLWHSLLNDHPEIHWVNPYKGCRYTYNTEAPYDIVTLSPPYCISREEREERQREIDDELPKFLEGIMDDTGDFETALQVYKNMAKEIDYDSLELDRQKRRREAFSQSKKEDMEPDDLRNIYGALVEKRTVCAGYARAYQYILQQLGMESIYVVGECVGGETHAWNIINMEGNYYHVDVTWGDGSNTDPSRGGKYCSYGYFGLNDKDIRLSRTINDSPPAPACTENFCNYFVRMGLYFKAYDHIAVKQKLAEMLSEAERTRVDLRFESAAILEAAENQLIHNGGVWEVLKNTGRSSEYVYFTDKKLNILTLLFDPEKADNQ